MKSKSYLFFLWPHTPNLQCQRKLCPSVFIPRVRVILGFYIPPWIKQASNILSLSLLFCSLFNLLFPRESLRWSFKYYREEMHFQYLSSWYCQFMAMSVILFQRIFIPTLHLRAATCYQCLQKYCEKHKSLLKLKSSSRFNPKEHRKNM